MELLKSSATMAAPREPKAAGTAHRDGMGFEQEYHDTASDTLTETPVPPGHSAADVRTETRNAISTKAMASGGDMSAQGQGETGGEPRFPSPKSGEAGEAVARARDGQASLQTSEAYRAGAAQSIPLDAEIARPAAIAATIPKGKWTASSQNVPAATTKQPDIDKVDVAKSPAPQEATFEARTATIRADQMVAQGTPPETRLLLADRPVLTTELVATSMSAPGTSPAHGTPIAQSASPVAVTAATIAAQPQARMAEIPLHVAQHLASGSGTAERLVVQLDPPELGRVSIDFQFDARGMQQVVVTGETPDAVRQLRMMQAELAQSLDRYGIGGGNLLFAQSDPGHDRKNDTRQPWHNTPARPGPGTSASAQPDSSSSLTHPIHGDITRGIDIRL